MVHKICFLVFYFTLCLLWLYVLVYSSMINFLFFFFFVSVCGPIQEWQIMACLVGEEKVWETINLSIYFVFILSVRTFMSVYRNMYVGSDRLLSICLLLLQLISPPSVWNVKCFIVGDIYGQTLKLINFFLIYLWGIQVSICVSVCHHNKQILLVLVFVFFLLANFKWKSYQIK